MAKKSDKLSAGIANLISGADQSVRHKQQVEGVVNALLGKDEQQGPVVMTKEPTTSQDEQDLLNTIEDDDLRKELESRLLQRRMVGRGRPRKNDQLGRRTDGYGRTTLIIPLEKWEVVKEIAVRETLTLKEIVELALDMVIERYESKHGKVTPQRREPRDIKEIF